MSAPAESKAELRSRLAAWRRSLGRPEIQRRSDLIMGHILSWTPWREAATVLVYLSTAYEVQTGGLLACGKRLAAPGVDGVLRLLAGPEAVRRSALGVPEPDPELCLPLSPAEVGLALLPGVAFDRRGGRLGRGGGFYDRLLPALGCPTCGLAFGEQVVAAVPLDPWDLPVGYLVTEAGVEACRAG